jgi:hypothetical protein
MTPKEISKNITKLISHREPVLLVGEPGLGKTDVITQVATELNHDLIVFHPVVDDPTNYKGLPCESDGNAKFLPYAQLKRLIEADSPTIAFFDDLGQATQSVQGALMQLFLSRKVNEHKISDQVVFVAATNSRKDRAGVKGLIKPLLSRFTSIIKVECSVDDWCDWASRNDMPNELVAFIRFRPDLLMNFDPSFVDSTGEDLVNQPCPRTVSACGRLLNLGVDNYEVLSGCVGESFTAELKGFLKIVQSLGDMPKDIANGMMVSPPSSPDIIYALCGALAHFSGIKDVYWQNISKWCQKNLGEEFQVLLVKDVESRYQEKIFNTTEYVDWVSKLHGLLNNE